MFPPSEPLPNTIDLPSGENDADATCVPLGKCVSCLLPVPSGWIRRYCDCGVDSSMCEWKRIHLPSGDQSGLSPSFSANGVSRRSPEPSMPMT
jgi:hypothetical protein